MGISRKIDYPIISENGEITHVMVPVEEFLAMRDVMLNAKENEPLAVKDDESNTVADGLSPHVYVPKQIIDAVLTGTSPLKAWREYKGFTEDQLAALMDISKAAYAQTEAAERPRITILLKAALALKIDLEQLSELY